jgi:hypothetical protein
MDRSSWPLAVSLTSAFAATMMARDARALGLVDVEVAGQVGLGTDPLINGGPNPLGFGSGGRAGVVLHGLYGGIAVTYYAGASGGGTFSEGARIIPVGNSYSSSDHALMYGIEVGYGFRIFGVLTIRPQVGLGNFTLFYTQTDHINPFVQATFSPTQSGSINNLYVEPGVTALVSLGMWLVGVGASVLVLPTFAEPYASYSGEAPPTDTAFTTHVQVGVRF